MKNQKAFLLVYTILLHVVVIPCLSMKLPYGLPAAFLNAKRDLVLFWLNSLLEEEHQQYLCFLVKVQRCNF